MGLKRAVSSAPMPRIEDPSSDPGRTLWHGVSAEEAARICGADPLQGLSAAEAARRLEVNGPNELPRGSRRTSLSLFLGQLRSPLIYLLLGAAVIALIIGETSDAIVILVVVLLNAVIGSIQEGRAEKSLESLRKLAAIKARILREGHELSIEAREVVPGDVLLIGAGDAIIADARLTEAASLSVSEAALTGESVPAAKAVSAVPADTPLADRSCMLYAGTYAAAGRGRALIVATGTSTEIGHIASLAQSAKEPKTPLERRIDQFGRYIIAAAVVLFALVMAAGFLRDVPLPVMLMIGISQIVGMIPEGLPVAMTIALAVGVQRMAKRGAVVRRLRAVETLGSTTVICTDKTGTLTKNEMTVTRVHLASGRELAASGSGYSPEGRLEWVGAPAQADLDELLQAVVLCNDAQLEQSADGSWSATGDPTEIALLTLALKGGQSLDALRTRHPRTREVPFDAAIKLMATEHGADASRRLVLKGAPEVLIDLCGAFREDGVTKPLDAAARARLSGAEDRLAAEALRLLAVAVASDLPLPEDLLELKGNLILLGLVGQIDPPRAEVEQAVRECVAAGIRPVMVTGDHKLTGQAIATSLGISLPGSEAVDGRELAAMSDEELASRIDRISVFARVHPVQKLRIVEAYRARDAVVAMTGDGVNDAPALSRADVGIAMGLSGTEVAKEASDMVITDDNFATIVAAVEEGRVVYRNLKKVILYLMSTSLAEVLVLLVAIVAGYPPPFAAVQILWNNLVTEGTVTINLIMEPPEGDEMQRTPVPPGEPLLNRMLVSRMVFMTPAIAASAFGWFVFRLSAGLPFPQVQTETFTVLAMCEWFNVMSCRSERRSVFRLRLLANRWLLGGLLIGIALQAAVVYLPLLNRVFHTVPIEPGALVAMVAVASLVLWVEELRKLVVRVRTRSPRSA